LAAPEKAGCWMQPAFSYQFALFCIFQGAIEGNPLHFVLKKG
jgi:hypothetical protein